ncbi:putative membrane protein [Burkholderia pseudomallei MSHR3709]|nr:putative membrane protein [Burkholderia pseudomallei MSHR3709]
MRASVRHGCDAAFLIMSITFCMKLLSISAIASRWFAWPIACCIAIAWSVVW